MNNFRSGQKLVCVYSKEGWRWQFDLRPWWKRVAGIGKPMGPDLHEVVTCDGYAHSDVIFLREYRHVAPNGDRASFIAAAFRPLLEADLTASLAETEARRLVEERPEVVREPQPSRA